MVYWPYNVFRIFYREVVSFYINSIPRTLWCQNRGNTVSKESQENGTSHTKHWVPEDIMELEVHKTQGTDWYPGSSKHGNRMSFCWPSFKSHTWRRSPQELWLHFLLLSFLLFWTNSLKEYPPRIGILMERWEWRKLNSVSIPISSFIVCKT